MQISGCGQVSLSRVQARSRAIGETHVGGKRKEGRQCNAMVLMMIIMVIIMITINIIMMIMIRGVQALMPMIIIMINH